MTRFAARIRPHVDAELRAADAARTRADAADEFRHLERAHVLGQASTREHVRVHLAMLAWAWRQRDARELRGQALRIVGAATKTVFGWVPRGNTGGANVGALQPIPVPPDLAATIERAQSGD